MAKLLSLHGEANHHATQKETVGSNVLISHSSSNRSTAKATAAVFNAPELLEAILLFVPARDLILTAPMVCRGFKYSIDASPELQKRTFRRATPLTDSMLPHEAFPIESPGLTFTHRSHPRKKELIIDILKVRHDPSLRTFQVARPAAKHMRLYIWRRRFSPFADGYWANPVRRVFTSEEGFTFGDVLDIVSREDRGYHTTDFKCVFSAS